MLFKKTDKILEYAELTTVRFTSLMPTIRLVEQQHIIPQLGNDLYTQLNDAYTAAVDETTLSDLHKTLLDKCRQVIGPYLCYYYVPKSEVKLSDAGAQRMETATNKTAYQNQVVNYREQNLREAELATEFLLQYLDEKKTDYPSWAASTGFAKYKDLFIKSGTEFNENFTSQSPYRNYMAMRASMQDVEQISIRPLLGDALFAAMKLKDQTDPDTFTDNEKDLLKKLKKVIAYLTVANAIPFLNVRMDSNGITVIGSGGRAQDDNKAKMQSADKTILDNLIEKCQAAAKSWINNVETFLLAKNEEFQTLRPDPLVTESQTTPIITDSQPTLGGSFGLI